MTRIVLALLLFFAFCATAAAQPQMQPTTQSSATVQTNISSTTTTVTPAKYYVDQVDLAQSPGSQAQKAEPSASTSKLPVCPSKGKAPFTFDPPLLTKYFLGEGPITFQVKTSDGCPFALTAAKGGDSVIKLSAPTAPEDSSGGVTSKGSSYTITLLAPGEVSLRAEETGAKRGQEAPSTEFKFEVWEDDAYCVADFLPSPEKKSAKSDASVVIPYLGNPFPFSFQAAGSKLLIYSAHRMNEPDAVNALKKKARELYSLAQASKDSPAASPAAAGAKPAFTMELSIPHYAALGDLTTKLSTVNYSDFTIQDVGFAKVRITSPSTPACAQLTGLIRNLRDVAWRPWPENPLAKLFFLNASDVTGAVGSGGGPGGSSAPAGTPSSTSGTTPGTGAHGTANAGATTSTTPTTTAGDTSAATGGSSPAASTATSPSGASGTNAAGSPAPSAGAQTAAPTVSGVGTDTLLFQDSFPGDDAGVTEKKRLVALLDLPRPQMIINVWSLQTSSNDSQAVEGAARAIHKRIDEYNSRIQLAIEAGWKHLRDKISEPANYFEPAFHRYVTGKYVQGPPYPDSELPPDRRAQSAAQRILRRETGTEMSPEVRSEWGICRKDEYCLGYTHIFQPLQPRLTDLLLATIASKTPMDTMESALDAMEGSRPDRNLGGCAERDQIGAASGKFYLECFRETAEEAFCEKGKQPSPAGLLRAALANFLFQYKLSQMYPHEFDSYELSQSAQLLDAALSPLVDAFNRDLSVFQAYVSKQLMDRCDVPGESEEEGCKKHWTDWVGTEKATFINNGLITVRTTSGFETTVNTTTQNFMKDSRYPTVSSLLQSIEGTHQSGGSSSTPAATTSTTHTEVTGANPSTTTTTTTTGPTTPSGRSDLLQNLTPIQAQVIMGALAAFQDSKVQIGRSLNVDIQPRSLSGASSADLTVKINADESANPTLFTSQSGNADISRVANHDTTTKVRVESIKMFDVSTFTAVLQKSRVRFPIILPFVELPYIGSIVGWPLPVAKEYHSSMAVLSTIIVPTAADIALGLTFIPDELVDSDGAGECSWPEKAGSQAGKTYRKMRPCRLRQAAFFSDLKRPEITLYHARMIACIANSMQGGHLQFTGDPENPMPALSTNCKLSLDDSVVRPK